MSGPKPLASVSAGLLACKGAARPAMRPKLYHAQDDIGWNDKGDQSTAPEAASRAVVPISMALSQPDEASVGAPLATLVRTFEAPAASARPRAAPRSRGKPALTLRLDGDRHLRLRLMGAHHHRSAQSLVTEALDRLLDEFEARKFQPPTGRNWG